MSPEEYDAALAAIGDPAVPGRMKRALMKQVEGYEAAQPQPAPVSPPRDKTTEAAYQMGSQNTAASDQARGQVVPPKDPFGQAAELMHAKVPLEEVGKGFDPNLRTATKRKDPGLAAPPEYVPPAPVIDPKLHPFDAVVANLGQVMKAMPRTFGGETEVWQEPSFTDFEVATGHKPGMLNFHNWEDKYNEFRDAEWVKAYNKAKAENRPIARSDQAPEGARDFAQGIASTISAADRALTFGIGGKVLDAGQAARLSLTNGQPFDREHVDALTHERSGGAPEAVQAATEVGASLLPQGLAARAATRLGGRMAGPVAKDVVMGLTAAPIQTAGRGLTEGDLSPDTNLTEIAKDTGESLISSAPFAFAGALAHAGERAHHSNLIKGEPHYGEAIDRKLTADRGVLGGLKPTEGVETFRGRAKPLSTAEQVVSHEMVEPVQNKAHETAESEKSRVAGDKEKFYAQHNNQRPDVPFGAEMAARAEKNVGELLDDKGRPLAGEVNERDLARHRKLLNSLVEGKVETLGEKGESGFFHKESPPDGPVDNYRKLALKRAGVSDAEIAKMTDLQAETFLEDLASETHLAHDDVLFDKQGRRIEEGPVRPDVRKFLQAQGVPDAAIDSMSDKSARNLMHGNWKRAGEGLTEPHVNPEMDTEPKGFGKKGTFADLPKKNEIEGVPELRASDVASREAYGKQVAETNSIGKARRILGDEAVDQILLDSGLPKGTTDKDVPPNVRIRMGEKNLSPKQFEQVIDGLQDPRQGPIKDLAGLKRAGHEGRERIHGSTKEMVEGFAKYQEHEHEKLTALERLYEYAGIAQHDAQGQKGLPQYKDMTAAQRKSLADAFVKYGGDLPPEQAGAIKTMAGNAGQGKNLESIRDNALTTELQDKMGFRLRGPLLPIPKTGAGARMRLDPALQHLGKNAPLLGNAGGSPPATQYSLDMISRLLGMDEKQIEEPPP